MTITEDTANQDQEGGNGNLYICFTHDGRVSCSTFGVAFNPTTDLRRLNSDSFNDAVLYNIFRSATVYRDKDLSISPLLVVEAGANFGGPGTPFGPIIWVCRPKIDRFDFIFTATGGGNTNTEASFVLHGPLAGDLIVAIGASTRHWPWPFGIAVYKLVPPGRYIDVSNFSGKSAQVGGPPGPVINADMPEI